MNRYFKWIVGGLLLVSIPGSAQEKPARWTLQACLDYARSQNIQIQKSRNYLLETQEQTKQTRSSRLPSLSFSSSHNYVNRPWPESADKNSYSGGYNLNSSVSLYNGGRLNRNIEQADLQNQVQELAVDEVENDIELSITAAFVQILYADETVKINQNTVEVSEQQRDRGRALLEAGSISRADFAQLESQYMTDKYQLVVAQTSLDNSKLTLKQLLELGISDSMALVIPDIPEEEVLAFLPVKDQIYQTSLAIMPEIKYNQLNINIATLEKEKARAGFLPSLNLSAGLGTGHVSGSDFSFGKQLKQSWNESVGLTLSVPIFSNRSNRTAVNVAKLGIENAMLDYESIRKDLLKSVETAYLDAVSAQNRFRSAKENLNALSISYDLIEQQFTLGMKNTVELLTEKNNYLSAQQELLQAKYMAVLNIQYLNFYQGKPIRIE